MEQRLTRPDCGRGDPNHASGLTLIELMVGMAVSLIVLSALTYVYVGTRGAYRSSEAIARVQENGRFAIDLLAREIRAAGYLGCMSRGVAVHDIRKGTATPIDWAGVALLGFENGSGWTAPTGIARRSGSDVLRYSGLVGNPARVIDRDGDPVNANIKVDNRPAGLDNGDPFIVTNCERATIANDANDKKAAGVVVHSAGKNELDEFKIDPMYTWESRSLLFAYDEVDFFVGRANANVPWSLYRYSMAKGTSEPIVENVEDMDVTFGVDTNGDGSADGYQDANAVAAGSNWPNVLSARVALLVRSTDNAAVPQPQAVYFRAGSATPDVIPAASDRYLRQTFTTTIALRNRLP